MRALFCVLVILSGAVLAGEVSAAPAAPTVVQPSPENEANPVRLPSGELRLFYMVRDQHVASISSTDHGRTWGEPRVEFAVPGPTAHACRSFVDRDGEIHVFFLVRRGEGRQLGIDRLLDIYHARTTGRGTQWEQPQRIFEGYCGALRGVVQMDNGRILLPFAYWVGGRPSAPPIGSNITTVIYSDDSGRTWRDSSAKLTSPCYEDYNGANYGAVEPDLIQLADGRVWMLIRTQTGFLYESSSDDGAEWSDARPAPFHSSNSPAALLRLDDGRLVVFWNNCEMPPRVDGAGVYGGRDALHAAISSDGGRTWQGFREVYLDPTRHQSPPRSGDRGTAYPNALQAEDGAIVLVTGQNEAVRTIIRFDPDWLTETRHADDFTNGLEGWSVFTSFGPAERWWRDRTMGAQLIDHPDRPGAAVLHVRRQDSEAADGAVWNFPMGRAGRLTIHLRLNSGFAGASIALGDRFFDPADDAGEQQAMFVLPIGADGRLGEATLQPGRWHTLDLEWDLAAGRCAALVDGRPAKVLTKLNETQAGVSYLRLRSAAPAADPAGWLVESVNVEVQTDTSAGL